MYYRKEGDNAGSWPEYEIVKPDELAGDYLDSVSFKVDWTKEFLGKVQEEKRYGEHIGSCSGGDRSHNGPVKYPEVQAYVPPNECDAITDPTPTSPSDPTPTSPSDPTPTSPSDPTTEPPGETSSTLPSIPKMIINCIKCILNINVH